MEAEIQLWGEKPLYWWSNFLAPVAKGVDELGIYAGVVAWLGAGKNLPDPGQKPGLSKEGNLRDLAKNRIRLVDQLWGGMPTCYTLPRP